MRFVSIEDARPGMCLAYDLYDCINVDYKIMCI